MAFAIVRIAKIGGGNPGGNAGGLGHHLERTMKVPNADPELARYNQRVIGSGDLWKDIQQRIQESGITPRSNAVYAVEHLITASPEFFRQSEYKRYSEQGEAQLWQDWDRWKAFQEQTLHWLTERYGKQNIVSFHVHQDEQTPHIHVVIVPIDAKGKLNARAYFGGREKLSQLQDSFAQAVEGLGLERGLRGSKAQHIERKQFYSALQELTPASGPRFTVEDSQPIQLENPPLFNREQWKQTEEARISAELARQATITRQAAEKYAQEVARQEQAKKARQIQTMLEARGQKRQSQAEQELKALKAALKQQGVEYKNGQLVKAQPEAKKQQEQSRKKGRGLGM